MYHEFNFQVYCCNTWTIIYLKVQLFNTLSIFYTIELKSFKCVKPEPPRNGRISHTICAFRFMGSHDIFHSVLARMKKNIIFLTLRQRLKYKYWVTLRKIDALEGNFSSSLHVSFPWQRRIPYSKYSGALNMWRKITNYKSCQDIPTLTVGKSYVLLPKLSNFAITLIRIEEFYNKKHEIHRYNIGLFELQNSAKKILLVLMHETFSKISIADDSYTSLNYFKCTT